MAVRWVWNGINTRSVGRRGAIRCLAKLLKVAVISLVAVCATAWPATAQNDWTVDGTNTPSLTLPDLSFQAGASGLSARAFLIDGGKEVETGLIWRVFSSALTPTGQYRLIDTSTAAQPVFSLQPGTYFINVAYGRANTTRQITVTEGTTSTEKFVLNAGGLFVSAVLPDGSAIPARNVTYSVFTEDRNQFGDRELVLRDAPVDVLLRLNAGLYHIVSTYGDANATVAADVTIEPGKQTNVKVTHSAVRVTLKLVNQPGGEALAGTRWQIHTNSGDLIKESAGALPTHILAAGSYRVTALRGEGRYQADFTLTENTTRQLEVLTR